MFVRYDTLGELRQRSTAGSVLHGDGEVVHRLRPQLRQRTRRYAAVETRFRVLSNVVSRHAIAHRVAADFVVYQRR